LTASSKGAILQHCCIGWLQNSYECVEKNHLLPSPDILLALCVESIFCLLEWVGGLWFFFPFFSSLFSLNSVWTENLGVDDNHGMNRLIPICTAVQAQLLLPMRDPSIVSCLYTSSLVAFLFFFPISWSRWTGGDHPQEGMNQNWLKLSESKLEVF
jgi:hypothetical protein